ncbi:hypothetical protein [Mesorhizobium sp. M1396]|uniref:hypothetical protein n=1 Tax=Mesorhizobium sp. M1396 TaxID=2957095 RepID=UPI0033382217
MVSPAMAGAASEAMRPAIATTLTLLVLFIFGSPTGVPIVFDFAFYFVYNFECSLAIDVVNTAGTIEFTRFVPDKVKRDGFAEGVANYADCDYSYACSG